MSDLLSQGKASFSRNDWSQILADAWNPDNSKILNDLRKDPKGTIVELAKETGGKYPQVAGATRTAAKNIQVQAETSPGEGYSGYLPIPQPTGGVEKLDLKDLEALIRNGLTGILQFDRQADIWAKEFYAAWRDRTLLDNIRRDPLQHLQYKDELLKDKYGVFPLPDRPRGLDKLTIDDLGQFLNDETNVSHISGIFLIGS
jgi:hypothetical protein